MNAVAAIEIIPLLTVESLTQNVRQLFVLHDSSSNVEKTIAHAGTRDDRGDFAKFWLPVQKTGRIKEVRQRLLPRYYL